MDISSSCFVFASAGSGKTTTLLNRYIASLFSGIDPQEILCITFTNAAVAEIEGRVSRKLEALYLNANENTEKYLRDVLGIADVSDTDIEKAEKLFFKFQDNLSQLKILTIHSFCQSLLQQFPLEAGVAPNFDMLKENEARELLREAKETVLQNIPEETLEKLAERLSIYTLEEYVNKIYELSSKFTELLGAYGSVNDYKSYISKLFTLAEQREFSKEQLDFIERCFKNENLEEKYLIQKGSLRKKIPHSDNPISQQIAEIIFANSQNRKKRQTIETTCAFLMLVEKIIEEYRHLKAKRNVLDFSDVLERTKFLLTKSYAKEFVISRVCSRIKSVMIDEAQDLSPLQWELVSLFSDDILSDPHSRKTLFVVGDIKQSIFRFQGADCKLLLKFYSYCSEVFEKSGRKLETQYLDKSYRSLPRILENVDKVFTGEMAKSALGGDVVEYKKHIPDRTSEDGIFELLEFEREDANGKADNDDIAKYVAQKIAELRDENSMILTRSRDDFSKCIVKELAALGVEIAPPDRVLLAGNLLVMDILAVADVCASRDDDYALACILKSPYIFEPPLTNDDLFTICHNRTSSIFDNLKSHFPEQCECLSRTLAFYSENNLREFFYKLVIGLHNISTEDSSILSAFMDEVTRFAAKTSENIPEFLKYIRTGDVEVSNKNDLSKLRLTTIHGSKGLEANTVFLLDFSLRAAKAKTKFIFRNEPNFFSSTRNSTKPLFFIKPSENEVFNGITALAEQEYAEEQEELMRLLYVAMTRARDRLYVFNCSKAGAVKTGDTAFELIKSRCYSAASAEL